MNDPPKSSVLRYAQDDNIGWLNTRDRWAAWEFRKEGVALVSQVLDPDLAGEEPIRREVAEKREALHRLDKRLVTFGVLAVCNEVEHFRLLCRRAIRPGLAVAPGTGRVEPPEQLAETLLVNVIFTSQQIDKLGRVGFDRTPRIVVCRNDGFAQCLQRLVLMRVEELRRVGRRGRLLVLDEMVSDFRIARRVGE